MRTKTIRAAIAAALTITASAVLPTSSFASGANLIVNGDFQSRKGSGNLSSTSYGYANKGDNNIPTDWVLSSNSARHGMRRLGSAEPYNFVFMFENANTTDTIGQSFDVLYRGIYKLSLKHGYYSDSYGKTTTKAMLTPSGGSAVQIGSTWTPASSSIGGSFSATTAVIEPQTYTLTFVPVSSSKKNNYAYSMIDDVVFALDTLVLEANEEISASTAIAPDAITLGAGATLNLTLATTSESMSGVLTLGEGSKIVLAVPDATAGGYSFATGGITLPSGASDASAFFTAPVGYEISFSNNGATLLVMKPTIAVTAEWKGNIGGGGFTDPANWTCHSAGGSLIENGLPSEYTKKYILTADADWTSTNLTLAAGVTLDLNGHNLAVENITGSGTVVDLANDQSVILAPDGAIYQKIQYVQATQEGANNKSTAAINKIQYVDTGYNHTSNTVVDIRVEFQDVSYSDNYGYAVFYGCRHLGTSASTACQLGGWIHGSKFYYYDTAEHDGSAAKVNTIYDVHLDKGGASYANYADGTRAAGLGTGNKNGPNTWGTDYIFANNQVSNGGKYWPCKCKVYSCTVCEGDEPKRDFVPVICISGANAGKAGFWCTVTEAFYGNSGYGTLTAGPAKKSATPAASSLTITVGENETLSLANVAHIGGNIKVVKAGAGTLTVPTTDVYFTGGVDVSAGALSITGPVTSLEGSNLGNVTVASGAKATIPATDGAKYGEAFTLNGGTLELVCSGTATPVTTYITNSVALNAGAKIRFDTSALDSTEFLLSTDGFTLGEGVESAVSCAELSAPLETMAEASGENGIHVLVLTEPVTAVWTGAANNNVFSDPGNWSCTNILGGALSGTVPDAKTEKLILGANADWTSTNLALAAGMTLDLNGHNLTVANLTGGMVVDTSGNLGDTDHNLFAGADGTLYLGVDYLQSRRTSITTGNGVTYNWGSQYIDTGYRHNANTVVDMKVAISDYTSNWYCYYGSRTSAGAQNQFAGWIHASKHMTGIANNASDQSWTYSYNVPFLVHLVAKGGGEASSIDGHTFTHSQDAIDSGYNDYLFRIYGADRPNDSYNLIGRIYYCTIKEDETVMRDFVPVRRISDGKPGMLDRAHGVFYVNGRTTEAAHDFTLGPVKKSAYVASGSVTITVGENETLSLANVAPIYGNIKVVKAGAGTLTVPTTGVYFTGGFDVSAGTLSIAGPVTSLEGSNLGNVTAASGTKVTIPATDGLKYGEAFTLNGSTLELVCSGTAEPVTTYITNSVALNAGAKIRFDTTALQATQFLLSTDGFMLGTGVESAVSCAELSDSDNTQAEANGANGILVTVVTAPVTAVWTGAANNNNLSDPGNWSCTNVLGGALVDTIPDAHTVNYVLAVDADWSAATVTIPEGATLNMGGHRLKVSGLAGTGTITDATSGYVALEYLQGSGSQYIKTGYTMNSSSTADFKAYFTGQPSGHWHGVFGQRSNGNDTAGACLFLYNKNNTTTFWKTLNGDDNTSLVPVMNTDYTFHISKTGAASTVTGGSFVNAVLGTATTTTCSGDAYIFNLRQGGGVWDGGRCAHMRLYYLTFSENGTPVHDFVPARRLPDGVLGLYDKNNGAFLVNSGSGSFTGGNVKSDLAFNPVAGGELEVYVAEGQTVTISTVNIAGSVKLVKTGLGTLSMAKAQTYLNGTEVEAGTIKPSTSSIATPYGEAGSKISATAGGTVDFNGNANMNKYVYDFADGAKALNGGAAISSGAFSINGFYTPVSTGSFTASLADGTTLDLTEWNGSWPISNVTAPAGATVTVKVDMDAEGFRTLATSKDAETGKNNGKLLSFGGARPADTAFVPDAASANRCRFIEDENGDIILAFLQGLTILIR